jgi:hypothetical protein
MTKMPRGPRVKIIVDEIPGYIKHVNMMNQFLDRLEAKLSMPRSLLLGTDPASLMLGDSSHFRTEHEHLLKEHMKRIAKRLKNKKADSRARRKRVQKKIDGRNGYRKVKQNVDLSYMWTSQNDRRVRPSHAASDRVDAYVRGIINAKKES